MSTIPTLFPISSPKGRKEIRQWPLRSASGACQRHWDTSGLHLVSTNQFRQTREPGPVAVWLRQDLVALA